MHGVFEDLTGKRFGRRVVLGRAPSQSTRDRDRSTYWRVRCDCGVEQTLRGTTITSTARCRACWSKNLKCRDMTGERYGALTVLDRVSRSSGNKSARWRVRCDCGVVYVACAENIRRATSCADCVRRRPKVTRTLVEVLTLAAEHPTVRPSLVVTELGADPQAAHAALRNAAKKGLLTRQCVGVYALAPAGLALLRDIAEGRRVDRWRLRGEIVAALDGGRASGRSTVRRVAA